VVAYSDGGDSDNGGERLLAHMCKVEKEVIGPVVAWLGLRACELWGAKWLWQWRPWLRRPRSRAQSEEEAREEGQEREAERARGSEGGQEGAQACGQEMGVCAMRGAEVRAW
jgi:hypothetical protein